MPKTHKTHNRLLSTIPDSWFTHVPATTREILLTLQSWIIEIADAEQLGTVAASLKWQQPSYAVKGGTPIRLGYTIPDHALSGALATENTKPTIALYVHCQTRLIEAFRELYPATPQDSWQWVKTRELRLDATQPLPKDMIRQFILFALTYQSRKAQPLLGG